MPPKRTTAQKPRLKPSVGGTFFCDGKPFALLAKDAYGAVETRAALETRIVNHIRILDSVTLTVGRRLIKTAIKSNRLAINIGVNPYDSEEDHESSHHPLSPQYRYNGKDIRKLEPLLVNDHTMLECTATLCYGDGGMSVENNDDAESALDIINENYREPVLVLYF